MAKEIAMGDTAIAEPRQNNAMSDDPRTVRLTTQTAHAARKPDDQQIRP